ncbi:hypothetical protein KAR91_69950 [Candidatus Pacearchaeota archaeon]|nr:hypothetical protein [Candidatus Pacearchaeota archaeon]
MKKKIVFLIILAGVISNIVGVLGPLHEMWHVIFSWFYGCFPEFGWGYTMLTSQNNYMPVIFAGMFGEIMLYSVIIYVAVRKKYYKTAFFFLGAMGSLLIIVLASGDGMFLLDIEAAYDLAPAGTVKALYNFWRVYYFILLAWQISFITLKCGLSRHKSRVFSRKVARKGGKDGSTLTTV